MRWQQDNSIFGYLKFAFFLIVIMPILMVMAAWQRHGCSKHFESPTPELTKWDIEITHLNPKPIAMGLEKPWNDVLLAKLQGMWENNLVVTVRGSVDEDISIHQEDNAGSIVNFFDPPSPEIPKDPPVDMVVEFYRIQGNLQTDDGPSPRYVMVEKYKGKSTAIVVFTIKKGPRTVCDWEGPNWFKNKVQTMKELDTTYFMLTGLTTMGSSGDSKANAEDVATLMKLAE